MTKQEVIQNFEELTPSEKVKTIKILQKLFLQEFAKVESENREHDNKQ